MRRARSLAGAIAVHLGLFVVLVFAAYTVPVLPLPRLPLLDATVANSVVLVAAVALVVVLGWGRDTGLTQFRVREPALLLPPFLVALVWFGTGGVEVAALLPVTVRMLAVGFGEEIIYRGVILRLLRPWGVVGACALSAVIFGLGHVGNALFFDQPWPQTAHMMVVATLFGLVYAPLRLRVGALWPLGLLHALTNVAETAALIPPPLWVTAVVAPMALVYAVWLIRPLRRSERHGHLPR